MERDLNLWRLLQRHVLVFCVGGIQTQIPSSTTQGFISLVNCNPDLKKKKKINNHFVLFISLYV